MALISGTIPTLLNGVSQQPPTERLPSQAELQENAVASPVDGLGKRPPTQHLASLTGSTTAWPHVHWLFRDDAEQYVVKVEGGDQKYLRVFDLKGNEFPVLSSSYELDYLNCNRPAFDLRAITIGDTTVYLNRLVKTAMRPETTPAALNTAFIFVKAGNYATKYTLRINGQEIGYTTPESDAPNESTTDRITRALRNTLKTSLPTEDWKVRWREGDSVIWIYRSDGAAFSIEAADGNGNRNLSVFQKTATKFSDLPSVAPNGFQLLLQGDAGSDVDDYYVTFVTDDGSELSRGTWQESAGPGITYQMDENTMPHSLRRLQDLDGTITGNPGSVYFKFSKQSYSYRNAGTEETNPTPSFIGSEIVDLFLHRNRLGFLSGPNVVMSHASDFFNFWKDSALELRDGDPIDVSVAQPGVINLRYAVPFNEELLLFAERSQLVLRGGDLLTPKTVSILPVTENEVDQYCKPIQASNFIYFPFRHGSHSQISEYVVDLQSNQKSAFPITAAVPRYLPDTIYQLSASANQNTLIALASGERGSAFVYQWLVNGSEKVQSSWGKWTFGENVTLHSFAWLNSKLYVLLARECGLHLERIDFSSLADDNTNYITHLDRRITDEEVLGSSYNRKTDTTVLQVPYRPGSTPQVVTRVDTQDDSWKPAVPVQVVNTFSDCDPTDNPVDPPDPPEPVVPEVTVIASMPEAKEEGPVAGEFTLFRTEEPTAALAVTVSYAGTATIASDYTVSPSGNVITFDAGESAKKIIITPVDDASVEPIETVVITVQPAAGGTYTAGVPGNATVNIVSDDADVGPDPCSNTLRISLLPTNVTAEPYYNTCEFGGGNSDNHHSWPAANLPFTFASPIELGTPPETNGGIEELAPGEAGFDIYIGSTSCSGGTVTPYSDTTAQRVVRVDRNNSGQLRFGLYFRIASLGTIFLGRSGWVSCSAGRVRIDNWTNVPENGLGGAIPSPGDLLNWSGDGSLVTSGALIRVENHLGYIILAWADYSAAETAPAEPSSLNATSGVNKINLSWTDNSNNETGFKVERSAGGSTGWTQIAQVGRNVTTFTNDSLSPSETYSYRVRAYNGAGDSAYTNVATATTADAGTGGGTGLGITMWNTGESRAVTSCGYVDTKWTFGTASARVHYDYYSVLFPWVASTEAAHWISYSVDTSNVNEASDQTRNATTTVEIDGGVDLSALTLTGKMTCDDILIDILVNGVPRGLSLSDDFLWTEMHEFTISGSLLRHGTNVIAFRVKNLSGAAPNPTGIIVEWNKPDAVEEESVDTVFASRALSRTIEPITQSEEVTNTCLCRQFIRVKGNVIGKALYIGESYTMRYRLSNVYLRTQGQLGGVQSLTGGRLQLATMSFNYAKSGYFRAEVTPQFRDTKRFVFTGHKATVPPPHIGEVPLSAGQFKFLVASKNDTVQIDLVNDSVLPSWVSSGEWEGQYTIRSRQV